MLCWRCGSMLASYTRDSWVVGVRILLLNDIFLSMNSLNSVKTFRKNSIKLCSHLTFALPSRTPSQLIIASVVTQTQMEGCARFAEILTVFK